MQITGFKSQIFNIGQVQNAQTTKTNPLSFKQYDYFESSIAATLDEYRDSIIINENKHPYDVRDICNTIKKSEDIFSKANGEPDKAFIKNVLKHCEAKNEKILSPYTVKILQKVNQLGEVKNCNSEEISKIMDCFPELGNYRMNGAPEYYKNFMKTDEYVKNGKFEITRFCADTLWQASYLKHFDNIRSRYADVDDY